MIDLEKRVETLEKEIEGHKLCLLEQIKINDRSLKSFEKLAESIELLAYGNETDLERDCRLQREGAGL